MQVPHNINEKCNGLLFFITFSIIITILSVKYHIKPNSDIRLLRKKYVSVSIMPLIYDL